MARLTLVLTLLALSAVLGGTPKGATPVSGTGFREDFKNLKRWKELFFPKVKAHSVYRALTFEGGPALRCESHASASALVLARPYDFRRYPRLQFDWRVDGIYPGLDPHKKSGDDYALRVELWFGGTPTAPAAWFNHRLFALWGGGPAPTCLNYVWANAVLGRVAYDSPYSVRVKTIALEGGSRALKNWIVESVSVPKDYRAAFKREAPPGPATVAVMDDSDDASGAAVSWLRYLQWSAAPGSGALQ